MAHSVVVFSFDSIWRANGWEGWVFSTVERLAVTMILGYSVANGTLNIRTQLAATAPL